jgi:hypothetical protein
MAGSAGFRIRGRHCQQILARRQEPAETAGNGLTSNIDRDRVDPAIAAALLFLAAEQYADANEAASAIRPRREGQLYEATILSERIADLARGQLGRILERGARWRRPGAGRDLEDRALAALLETLITGLEIVAARFLGLPAPPASADRFDSAGGAFMRVLQLSAEFDGRHSEDWVAICCLPMQALIIWPRCCLPRSTASAMPP